MRSIHAANAKKHILCEKPMALNQYEAQRVFDAVRRNGVCFMEAFMYRCHPQTLKLAELIRSKIVGDVRVISATFSFNFPHDPKHRLLANELAGGGILDVGCYPVSMTNLLAGAANGKDFCEPLELKALGKLGATGVDEYAAAVATYEGGILAQFSTGVQAEQDSTLRIYCSKGRIEVPGPWIPAREGGETTIVVRRDGVAEAETIAVTCHCEDHLYSLEADALGDAVAQQQGAGYCSLAPGQSPRITWADSMGILRTLDRWREQIGLTYEIEKPGKPPVAQGGALAVRADSKMEYAAIPGVEKKILRVLLGLDNQFSAPHMAAICDDFFERGGNAFDSAHQYQHGLMESLFGAWQRSRGVREQIVLVGKGAHTPDCLPDKIGPQLQASLERLQTDYVDLYFMHRDNPSVPVGEFIDALNEQVRKGRIRGPFGGSNWSLARIDEANAYARERGLRGLGAVSNHFSLARMVSPPWEGCIATNDDGSKAWFRGTRLPLFAWSSQARGFFTSRVARNAPLDEEVARCWASDGNWQRKRRVEELATKRGAAPINIALAYVLNQHFPIFALIGPRTIDETREDFGGVGLKLTCDELKWLNLRWVGAAVFQLWNIEAAARPSFRAPPNV